MMNSEVKAKWLAALRSGQYAQTKGCLKTDTNFCCLGVLCDLHQKEVGTIDWIDDSFGRVTHYPPNQVLAWAGLNQQIPKIPFVEAYRVDGDGPVGRDEDGNPHIGIGDLNDRGFSFDQIADIIEAKL